MNCCINLFVFTLLIGISDRPFYPEIHYEGEYYPICGIDFNDEAATTACRDIDRLTEINKDGGPWPTQEKFTYGGRVVKTNSILEQDAMPVGACLKGETLDSCTAGSNAFGDFAGLDGRCSKGNPVGVQIVCQRQCRKFGENVFTENNREMVEMFGIPMDEKDSFKNLKICEPFLKNTTTYYLEDRTVAIEGSRDGPSIIEQFASLLNVMNQECSENVLKLICHTVFKQCKEVEVHDEQSLMLPSLLCKEECERHKAMWDICLAKMRTNADDEKWFNSNMEAMAELMNDYYSKSTGGELPQDPNGQFSPFSLLDCDAKAGWDSDEVHDKEVAASWILGRYPQTHFDRGNNPPDLGIIGWAFPRFMSSNMLYPEAFSTYTGPDGVSHEVPCTIPGQADVFKATCPDLFVNAFFPETNRGCVYACPVSYDVNQFTIDDYNTMWTVFVTIGMCSFFLNMFMVCTWELAGFRKVNEMPFQLKACVFLGILYGVVETLPSLFLKFDLPCVNETVEEVGSSVMCYVNRSGQYILLGIMVNLCTLTAEIYRALANMTSHESHMIVNVLSTGIPFLFMVIAYILDTDEEGTENYNLNAVRHAFSCSMRFSTMLEEWLVLWLPFCISGILTAIFSIASWWKIGDIERSLGMIGPDGANVVHSDGQRKLEAQRRRLIRIGAMVSACLLLNVGTALSVTSQQSAWAADEEKMLDCFIKTATRNWKDYNFNDEDVVKNICKVPEDHHCSIQATIFKIAHPLEDDNANAITPSCIWNPEKSTDSLVCSHDELLNQYPYEFTEEDYINASVDLTRYLPCDCPCSDLLPNEVERPSTFVMTLSFAGNEPRKEFICIKLKF